MKTYLFLFFLLIINFCFAQVATIGGVINTYTPVLALNPCNNSITVEDASTFNPGDTVLIIQMQDAIVDSSNTASFGTIIQYNNSGNYEFNYVKSRTGNIIELKNILTRPYDIPTGKVQLVRVPYYTTATVTSTLTCLPWDGSKGGILVLNARDNIDLAANIDVTGKGFRGGNSPNPNTTTLYCQNNGYFYAKGNLAGASKGEGIALISNAFAWGKGSAANGGGGGDGHNSGGGGGSNGGSGGFGGYQLEACGNAPFDNRGIGGRSLNYNNISNKIFMGGGGGSGHTDNAGGSGMPGGNGGGIVIIKSALLNENGFSIKASGNAAPQCNLNPIGLCHDGNGGGGGGGTILIDNTIYSGSTNIDVSGGKGGDLVIFNNATGAGRIGPGGGGGAGAVWFNSSSLPPNVTVTKNGGATGVIIQNNNDPWGATAGQPGVNVFNLNMPVDVNPFKKNIDSVKINEVATSCSGFDFAGLGYTNASPIATWQWNFGDGNTASTQNTSHIYSSAGNYTMKLIVTDVNGCKDSIIKTVNGSSLAITKSNDTTVCKNGSIQLFANGGNTYLWTPATYLNNPNIPNPVSSPQSPITYYVTVTNALGCSNKDSIKLSIKPSPVFSISPDQNVCTNSSQQLLASGGNYYLWQPSGSLDNPNIPNPIATPTGTTTYSVKIKDNTCNDSTTLSTTITALSLPIITVSKSNDIDCSNNFSQLNATGGKQYTWQPGKFLNDSTVSNPIATLSSSTLFLVNATDNNGCKNTDTITVYVNSNNKGGYFLPNAFTPNNDGLNDCFGLKPWGTVTKLDFSIYNRFGERIFYTTDSAICWDGTYKGVPQNVGAYVYIIKAITPCNVINRKGTVMLLR